METSLVDAGPMLAIDIGATTTRVFLFDVVEGRYRFLAEGSAPTTIGEPLLDVSEGVRLAVDSVQEITGRVLLNPEGNMIVPSQPDGSGVDAVVVTLSAGPPLSIVAVGLLDEVSLESVRHLAETTYARVVEQIGLTDGRSLGERIDVIIKARPDVILIAGGTQGGAARSMLNLIEVVGLASYLIPTEYRPEILFAGNKDLEKEVRQSLETLVSLHVSSNVRPSLEVEDIGPALKKLSEIYTQLRYRQIPGLQDVGQWADDRVVPAATGFGRVIRFLSQVYDPTKGVLGVRLESNALTMVAGFKGELVQAIYPDLGIGMPGDGRLTDHTLVNLARWLAFHISFDDLQDIIYNMSLFPASVSVTREELAIEQAMVRCGLQLGVTRLIPRLPAEVFRSSRVLLPWFEPIIVSGEILNRMPSLSQTLLMLLDGLQPTGITTLVLDQSYLAPVLGAVAETNPLMTIQVLESNAFVNLGTTVSLVGRARRGTPVLRLQVKDAATGEVSSEVVRAGSIKVISVTLGQVVQVAIQPLHGFDAGFGAPGRGGELRVVGGAVGLVIDARGRPIRLPREVDARRGVLLRWQRAMGG